MPLNGMIVKKDATSITVVGGTDQTLTNDGQAVSNGIHLIDAANADFRTRRNAICTVRQPTYNKVNGYSKDKKSIALKQPLLLVSGETVINILRIEREVHPETTAAAAVDLNRVGAQLLSDTDLDSFWTAGSVL